MVSPTLLDIMHRIPASGGACPNTVINDLIRYVEAVGQSDLGLSKEEREKVKGVRQEELKSLLPSAIRNNVTVMDYSAKIAASLGISDLTASGTDSRELIATFIGAVQQLSPSQKAGLTLSSTGVVAEESGVSERILKAGECLYPQVLNGSNTCIIRR